MSKQMSIISSIGFVLFLCLLDFFSRLVITHNYSDATLNFKANNSFAVKLLSPPEVDALTKLLATFDVEKPATPPVTVAAPKVVKPQVKLLSIAEQMQQQGKLSGLFDGSNKFTLVATFDDQGKKFALIHQKNLINNAESNIRLFVGQSIANYKLTQVSSNSVDLVQGDRLIQLQLFLIK